MKIWTILRKFWTRQEPIAGLEITDNFIRLVLLNVNKENDSTAIKEYAEQPLAPGIIINGIIKDAAKLSLALLKLKKSLKMPADYIIASIPSDTIYTKILSFPKSIEGLKLVEAIKLAIDFQLPRQASEVYCSWEIFSGQNLWKVFAAEAPKKIIDPYIDCIRKVFNLVALEFHAVSFSRVASFEKNKPVLLKITNQSSNSFFVIKDNVVYFSRTLEQDFPPKKLKKELEKIINFYESSSGEKISKIIDLEKDVVPIDKKINFPELKNNQARLIALGAATRGTILRSQDNFISLLPISTQKAYKYQKAVSFTSLISKLIIGLAIFFAGAFLGVWLLMTALQQRTAEQADYLKNSPISPELTGVEQKIQTANALISTTAEIIKTTPQWSLLIAELQKSIISGVTVNGLNLPAADEVMNITGIASNRVVLNQFRDKLKSSLILDEIKLPLTNLDKKEDIPFTISFRIKNPESIYFK